VILGQIYGGTKADVVDTVALGQICGRYSGTGADLWWTHLHWYRFMVDTLALVQIYVGIIDTGADLW